MVSNLRVALVAAAGLWLAAASAPTFDSHTAVGSVDQAVTHMVSLDTSYSFTLDGQADSQATATQTGDTPTGNVDEAHDINAPAAQKAPATLFELVNELRVSSTDMSEEMRCLATAVYFESKGEPLNGQLAVAQVILNRVDSNRFAASVCGVVYQPSQFSFGHSRVPAYNSQSWRNAVAIARVAMDDMWPDVAPRALFFHATHVSPKWNRLTRVSQIGRHIFYR